MLTAATLANVAPVRAVLSRDGIRAGDVLRRAGSEYRTADGRAVAAWVVALHLGGAFEIVKLGQQELRT